MNRAVIDIETGGFSIEKNGICEIAMLIIDDQFEPINERAMIIAPYRRPDSSELVSYKQGAMDIHGIPLHKLQTSGVDPGHLCKVFEAAIDHYEVTEFIGHNIKSFDGPRMNYFFGRFGTGSIDFKIGIDTMVDSRKLYPGISHNLPYLCMFHGIENKAEHRALGDCYATLEVFKIHEKKKLEAVQ